MVDRYAHFVDEMRKDAATKMDAILNPVAVNVSNSRNRRLTEAEIIKRSGATRQDRTGDLLITNNKPATFRWVARIENCYAPLPNVASFQRNSRMLRLVASTGAQRFYAGSRHKNGHSLTAKAALLRFSCLLDIATAIILRRRIAQQERAGELLLFAGTGNSWRGMAEAF